MSEVKRVEFGSPEEFLDFLGFLGIELTKDSKGKTQNKKTQKKESPIKNVIFNKPATIIEWFDGTKTVVKCDKHDKYDKATGLALCICKYIMGSGEFHKEFNKWVYGVTEAPAKKKVAKNSTKGVVTKKPTKKSEKTVKKSTKIETELPF